MGKHLLALSAVLLLIVLGYGMWLYSESLRTGVNYGNLLKQDLTAKRAYWGGLLSKNEE